MEIPVWQYQNLTLIEADFTEPILADDSVDLIVTSPPYNLRVDYGPNCQDNWPYDQYLLLQETWLNEAKRVIKADGRICWNVPFDTSVPEDKQQGHPVAADVLAIAQDLGLKYHPSIVWQENNVSRRQAWGSFAKASAPRGFAPIEIILLLYKESWDKFNKGGSSDITHEEFID
jgi:site-specific DNA-methyltransferase (adenine-specific)